MVSAHDPRVRLRHVLENIDGVLAITAGLKIEAIVENFALIRATERAIQIISEAAKELPPDIRALEPNVPWRNIIGIGNMLRHEYYRIDTSVLDAILKQELPDLRLAVLRLIAQIEGSSERGAHGACALRTGTPVMGSSCPRPSGARP